MLRYVLAAQALRLFSLNSATRKLYRILGNKFGGRNRALGLPPHYLMRADSNLTQLEQAGGIRDAMSVMEIGTGWAHWESLFLRCFYDVSILGMDVWDNRQFLGFKAYARELNSRLDETTRSGPQKARAKELLTKIDLCRSFDEVYDVLNFRYVVGVENAYEAVGENELDVIYSSDVLEHVPADAAEEIALQHYRMLKPGGISSHQIVPADHLCIYDNKVNNKNYLRYNDIQWNLLFSNKVQYINRLQMNDWRRAFEKAGFDVTCNVTARADISKIKIAQKFARSDNSELEITVFHMIAKKPDHTLVA